MKRSLIAFALTGAGIALSSAAHAVNVDVNIGTPAPVVVAPAPAPVIVAPAPAIVVGWHGDRYWDGHRYWNAANGKNVTAVAASARRDTRRRASADAARLSRATRRAKQRYSTAARHRASAPAADAAGGGEAKRPSMTRSWAAASFSCFLVPSIVARSRQSSRRRANCRRIDLSIRRVARRPPATGSGRQSPYGGISRVAARVGVHARNRGDLRVGYDVRVPNMPLRARPRCDFE